MPHDNRLNPGRGKAFQIHAAELLADYFKCNFVLEHPIPIGSPPKEHKFDLVSTDRRYVGECKNHSWTETGNIPSAKMAFLNEAVLYLSLLPEGTIRFIVLPKSIFPRRSETLAEYYYRTYNHLLGQIILVELDLELGKPRILGSQV